MWGDVGLGPLSGCLVMEADKGCGAEGVVGWRWLCCRGGAMWGDVGRGGVVWGAVGLRHTRG